MKRAKIFYFTLTDEQTKLQKLDWFGSTKFAEIPFNHLTPDEDGTWINQAHTDFESLLPLAAKPTKAAKEKKYEQAVFKLFSGGAKSNRDEWVYDDNENTLEEKIKFFAELYNQEIKKWGQTKKSHLGDVLDTSIKWSRDLKNKLISGKKIEFEKWRIMNSLHRPFIKRKFYAEPIMNDVMTDNHIQIHGKDYKSENQIIAISGTSSLKPFHAFSSSIFVDYDALEKTQCLPLYRYDGAGNRVENITDWGLEKFRERYKLPRSTRTLMKPDIFHYVYAVLHNPAYRKKYELNLKREFPRVPFYSDFWKWAAWGKRLIELHLNYETMTPFALKRLETPLKSGQPKAKLKADKVTGSIHLDEETTLSGVPKEAWEYKLGNRSALEWIIDQYKESTPKDKTIAEKFDTYRFVDYKEVVIELLMKVCTVSVETMKVLEEMKQTDEGKQPED